MDKPLESKFLLRAARTLDEPPTVATSTSGYDAPQDILMTESKLTPPVSSRVALDGAVGENIVAYYIEPSGRIVAVDI
jgi:hypothetical protein